LKREKHSWCLQTPGKVKGHGAPYSSKRAHRVIKVGRMAVGQVGRNPGLAVDKDELDLDCGGCQQGNDSSASDYLRVP
jgi:hypothetical protein